MKHAEILEKIMAAYPPLPFSKTCDTIKFGDPSGECTGITTSCALTVDVIHETIRRGANLIIVHEPCFYTHDDKTDWLAGDEVFEKKAEMLREADIVVWRDHDHMHTAKPDEIFAGFTQAMEWSSYQKAAPFRTAGYYVLPPMTLRDLARHLRDCLHLSSGRVVGNMDAMVSKVALAGHIFPSWDDQEQNYTKMLARDDVDVLLALECIEWTTMGYARDAAQLGMNKAIIQAGHFVTEEPGMPLLADHLRLILGDAIPVSFIASGDPWQSIQ